jgi:hypothetical protein
LKEWSVVWFIASVCNLLVFVFLLAFNFVRFRLSNFANFQYFLIILDFSFGFGFLCFLV